jgi:hypothetical protein
VDFTFKMMDLNGDGNIDAKEVKTLLMHAGEQLSEEEADDLVRILADGAGVVTIESFRAGMDRIFKARPSTSIAHMHMSRGTREARKTLKARRGPFHFSNASSRNSVLTGDGSDKKGSDKTGSDRKSGTVGSDHARRGSGMGALLKAKLDQARSANSSARGLFHLRRSTSVPAAHVTGALELGGSPLSGAGKPQATAIGVPLSASDRPEHEAVSPTAKVGVP